MTLGFIVRVEFDGRRWTLTLHDLANGERRRFDTFGACGEGLRMASEAHLPAVRREGRVSRGPDGAEGS
jgi:hypothetical protein